MSQAIVIPTTSIVIINTTGIPPLPGTIGEQIQSFVGAGSSVSLSIGVPKTITSLMLTTGIWDVTSITSFSTGGSLSATTLISGISTTSGMYTGTTNGDNLLYTNAFPQAGSNQPITIPQFRINVTTNTTYYLVASAIFSSGTLSAFGRISAVRVC